MTKIKQRPRVSARGRCLSELQAQRPPQFYAPGMSRKAGVGTAAAICGAIAASLALWARSTYQSVETMKSFYYAMIGYPMWRIDGAAAADAAKAVSGQTTMAWVFLAVALALMVAAILVRNDEPSVSEPATTPVGPASA